MIMLEIFSKFKPEGDIHAEPLDLTKKKVCGHDGCHKQGSH